MQLNVNKTDVSYLNKNFDISKAKRSKKGSFVNTLLNRSNGYEDSYVASKQNIVYSSEDYYDLIHNTVQKKCIKTHNSLAKEHFDEDKDQESETRTDIIVKPDGSRVLVVTMKIGGMETTMSLELSKPTNELNEMRDNTISTDEQAVMDDNLRDNLDSGTFI